MGESSYIYNTDSFSSNYPECQESNDMVPYTLSNSETYGSEEKEHKSYHENLSDDFSRSRNLQHMSSLSTTCTVDSVKEAMNSAESNPEPSVFTEEPPGYAWPIQHAHTFQWPPNHNLATPPLDSPINFHQLGYASQPPQMERRPSFPNAIPTPTSYYNESPNRPSMSVLPNFSYGGTQMAYSRSSGGNSRSATPTIQSPALSNHTPRPTKKGSISTDAPTGRNRTLSDFSLDTVSTMAASRENGRRRSSLSASQHHLSRSPNRHQRRPSGLHSLHTLSSYPIPVAEDLYYDDKEQTGRRQIKRSKSANTILINQEAGIQDIYHHPDLPPEPESSGDDGRKDDEMLKTKAARAQSEHRRRVELKDSFERLRLILNVPQPRAGKRDLVEQAISALEFYKRKEEEMQQEINYLRGLGHEKRSWRPGSELLPDEDMQM